MNEKDQNQTPEIEEQNEQQPTEQAQEKPAEDTPIVPSSAELMRELAELKANYARTKSALDKTASEAGDLRKQLRARQTEAEVEAEEKAKIEQAKEQRMAELEREINHGKAIKRYMSLGMKEDMADTVATAELDGDMATVTATLARFMAAEKEAAKEAIRAELLAQMPTPISGNGDGQVDYQKQATDALAAGDVQKFIAAQISAAEGK